MSEILVLPRLVGHIPKLFYRGGISRAFIDSGNMSSTIFCHDQDHFAGVEAFLRDLGVEYGHTPHPTWAHILQVVFTHKGDWVAFNLLMREEML